MRFDFNSGDAGEWRTVTERAGLSESQAGHLLMLLIAGGAAARQARSDQARKAANARWQCRADASASKPQAGSRTGHSPNERRELTSPAQGGHEESHSLAIPAPPPDGTQYYTTVGANPVTGSFCDQTAPKPAADAHASTASPRVCVLNSSLNKEENSNTKGGAGGGCPARPLQGRLAFPPAMMEEMPARRIVDAYEAQVKSAYRATQATVRTVSWWLAHGQTEASLMLAVKNYAADMDRHQKAARYRKGPGTFFSRSDPVFVPFTTPRGEPPRAAPKKPAPAPEKPASKQLISDFLARARATASA